MQEVAQLRASSPVGSNTLSNRGASKAMSGEDVDPLAYAPDADSSTLSEVARLDSIRVRTMAYVHHVTRDN